MSDPTEGGSRDRGPRKRNPPPPKRGAGRPAPGTRSKSREEPEPRPASKRAGRRPPGAVRRGEQPWTKDARPVAGERSGDAPTRHAKPRPWAKRPYKGAGARPGARPKGASSSDEPGLVRLNRYLAQSGICSRREADDLIKAGVVTVNGKVVTEMGTKVQPSDTVHYGGQRLSMEKKRYVLLNKPKGFITTTDDPRNRRTVMALIDDACSERLYPVGRLDRQTTGLLLMTNDGDLAKKLTHPSHGAEKVYHVTLDKNVTKAHLEQLVTGVMLEDGPAQADEVNYVDGAGKSEVGLRIHMGRNRVVRRMFEALGYEVVKLDRVVFAGLTKKDLPRGNWRHLTEKEVLFLSKRR